MAISEKKCNFAACQEREHQEQEREHPCSRKSENQEREKQEREHPCSRESTPAREETKKYTRHIEILYLWQRKDIMY